MKIKKTELAVFKKVAVCGRCGGDVDKLADERYYLVDPQKAKYNCNKCGKEYTLSKSEFPGIVYEEKNISTGWESK